MKILWAEAENRTPHCHSTLLMLCVLYPLKVFSIMLGMEGNVEGGTTQIAKYLTQSSLGLLSVASRRFTDALYPAVYPHPTRTICHWGFPSLPIHSTPASGDFSSAFTLVCLSISWADKFTSPSTGTKVTCTFSQSYSSDTQMNPGIPPHTYRERLPSFLLHGPVLSQQWPDKTWQLQARLNPLRFYRLGRQQKGNSYFKIQITPIQTCNRIP